MKRVATCLALTALLLTTANAGASIILNSLAPVSENFDGLMNTGTLALAGTGTVGVQASVGLGWEGAKTAGTNTNPMQLIAGTGSGTSGALYSFGASGSGERALGSVGSGSYSPAFGVEIINNTGGVIDSVTISATTEFWRSSTTTQNVHAFGWGVSGGTATSLNYLTDAGAGNVLAGLDVVGPAAVGSNGALDGNDPLNQGSILGTINLSLAHGSSLFIRWTDTNDIGNDAGLAIDNLNIEVTPEPSTLALLGLGAVALLRRRK